MRLIESCAGRCDQPALTPERQGNRGLRFQAQGQLDAAGHKLCAGLRISRIMPNPQQLGAVLQAQASSTAAGSSAVARRSRSTRLYRGAQPLGLHCIPRQLDAAVQRLPSALADQSGPCRSAQQLEPCLMLPAPCTKAGANTSGAPAIRCRKCVCRRSARCSRLFAATVDAVTDEFAGKTRPALRSRLAMRFFFLRFARAAQQRRGLAGLSPHG